MSEALLIRHCSPTLAGLKTGSLFPAVFGSEEEMQRDMQDFNRRFRDKGVRLVPLRYSAGKALLYPLCTDLDTDLEKKIDPDSDLDRGCGRCWRNRCTYIRPFRGVNNMKH